MNSAQLKTSAIVFDLDDTLYLQVDFKRSGFCVVARWLELYQDIPARRTLNELDRILLRHGPSYPRIFDELLRRLGLSLWLTPALVQVFTRHRPAIRTFPGVHRLLDRLQKKYYVGILTDGRPQVQRRKFHTLNLAGYVDAILFSGDLNLCKPAEKLFEWFEKRFSLLPSQLIYIGDNPRKDFIGARLRGWKTVRVLTGEHTNPIGAPDEQAIMSIPSVLALEAQLNKIPFNNILDP